MSAVLNRARSVTALAAVIASISGVLVPLAPAAAVQSAVVADWTTLQTILSRNTSTLTAVPTATPDKNIPDGALLGNGHLTAAVGGAPTAQTYYIGATDFWQDTAPKTIGGVTVSIPSLSGASYNQQQDILNAEARSTFANASASISQTSWVSANEDLMVLTISSSASSTANTAVTVDTFAGAQTALPTSSGLTSNNTMWATRTTGGSTWLAHAALASRVLGGSGVTYSTNSSTTSTASFSLAPGQSVRIATVLGSSAGNVSGSPWPAPTTLAATLTSAQTRVGQLNATAGDANSVLAPDALHAAHLAWWKNFWLGGGSIDLGGGSIERFWYTSLYAMAVSNRAGRTAPPMTNFLTDDNPIWKGFWATNYDFEMPYQGLYAANHIELTEPYERAVMDCVPSAQAYAAASGYQGVLNGTIMTVGGQQCDSDLMAMKGNAAWLSTNFVSHWNYTHDTAWATATGYPYLVQVANFWDSYLTKTGGVYNITGSAQNEGSGYRTNPIGDLSWLRYLYPALLDMSTTLNVDAGRRALWQDIVANLAPYPTFTNNGHTDFKATQDAPGFYSSDANPANPVFPGNTIDLGSPVSSIITAQNTITDLNAWCQTNSFAWIFPAAARVGLPGTYNLLNAYLSGGCGGGLRGNTTVIQDGGGAETFGGMETVSSMLMTSATGSIRLFPSWPHSRPASFTNMLASGSFSVSSSLSSGIAGTTTLTSKAGLPASIASPWAPGTIVVTDTVTGAPVPTTSSAGNVVTFTTVAGRDYRLTGSGSYDYTRLNLAQGGPASASSAVSSGGWSVGALNDGQRTTTTASRGWSSSGSTSTNHTEWAQVDLGSSRVIGQVDLYPRNDSANVGQGFPVDFTIAVSNDGSTWTTVVTKTGAPLPATMQSFSFANRSARYVRVTGTSLRANAADSGQYRMQLAELEAYAPTNAARTAAASSSSSFEGGQWSVNNVNDGDRGTGWSSNSGTGSNHTEWIQLDLGSARTLGEVDLYPRFDSGQVGQGFPIDFTIATSNDASTWTTVVSKTGYALPSDGQFFPFATQSARYIRVTGTNLRANANDGGNYRMQFSEVEAYAPDNKALTAVATSSSTQEVGPWSVKNVNDGNTATGWTSGEAGSGANHTEWVQVDRGASLAVAEVDLTPRTDAGNVGQGFPMDFTIAGSDDGTTWTTLVTKTGYAVPSTVQAFTFASTSARYIRVTGTTLRANSADGGRFRMQLAELGLR